MKLTVQIDLGKTPGSSVYMQRALAYLREREVKAGTFSVLSALSPRPSQILITDNPELAKAFVLMHERPVMVVLVGNRRPKKIPGFYDEIACSSLKSLEEGLNEAILKGR